MQLNFLPTDLPKDMANYQLLITDPKFCIPPPPVITCLPRAKLPHNHTRRMRNIKRKQKQKAASQAGEKRESGRKMGKGISRAWSDSWAHSQWAA